MYVCVCVVWVLIFSAFYDNVCCFVGIRAHNDDINSGRKTQIIQFDIHFHSYFVKYTYTLGCFPRNPTAQTRYTTEQERAKIIFHIEMAPSNAYW